MEVLMKTRTIGSRIAVLFVTGLMSVGLMGGVAMAQGNTNGAAGEMPTFYEGRTFTVNMLEVPAADGSLLDRNRSINTIYATNDLDDEQDFLPVIDAIQGEGFNPLWQQVLIEFNNGVTPHQFVSE